MDDVRFACLDDDRNVVDFGVALVVHRPPGEAVIADGPNSHPAARLERRRHGYRHRSAYAILPPASRWS